MSVIIKYFMHKIFLRKNNTVFKMKNWVLRGLSIPLHSFLNPRNCMKAIKNRWYINTNNFWNNKHLGIVSSIKQSNHSILWISTIRSPAFYSLNSFISNWKGSSRKCNKNPTFFCLMKSDFNSLSNQRPMGSWSNKSWMWKMKSRWVPWNIKPK